MKAPSLDDLAARVAKLELAVGALLVENSRLGLALVRLVEEHECTAHLDDETGETITCAICEMANVLTAPAPAPAPVL
jgi:hypothetical protein